MSEISSKWKLYIVGFVGGKQYIVFRFFSEIQWWSALSKATFLIADEYKFSGVAIDSKCFNCCALTGPVTGLIFLLEGTPPCFHGHKPFNGELIPWGNDLI